MLKKSSFVLMLLAIACCTSIFGQQIPDRSLPYSYQSASDASKGLDSSDSTKRPNVVQEKEMELNLAEAHANMKRVELQNLRLKLELQKLQLHLAQLSIDGKNQDIQEQANVIRAAVWSRSAWPNLEIPVSWENPTDGNAEGRVWVRQAIASSWEKECGIKFTGWGKTSDSGDVRGIRIRIADEGPHVKRLGNRLDGVPQGMVLNFTFGNWCPACASDTKGSIEKIAVHEFGHALGFAHEQNRTDAPLWCQEERQGSNGDWYITIYDPNSIMNYCSPEWNNAGKLTDLDKEAARTLYGNPTPEPVAIDYDQDKK